MLTAFVRASLLTLSVGVCALPASGGQPSGGKDAPVKDAVPTFTAFPDLKPPELIGDGVALIPILPDLPANAPPLRAVRYAQAQQGIAYLARISELIRTGSWTSQLLFDTILMAREVYPVAADAEDQLANRIPWYEERVRKLKELERLHVIRAGAGSDRPLRQNYVRYHRLQAELELIALKDAVTKAGGQTPRPLAMKRADTIPRAPDLQQMSAPETAFPGLKAWTEERKVVPTPDGKTKIVYEEKGRVPLPRLPILPVGASLLRTVRHEQVLEGFGFVQSARPVPMPLFDTEHPDVLHYFRHVADTYRSAAELEECQADRVPWYEAGVRAFKVGERIIAIRVLNGAAPPQQFDSILFHRLQAEAELLHLKSQVDRAEPATGPAPAREATSRDDHWGQSPVNPRPFYTAFPDLKPSEIERIEVKDPDGMTHIDVRSKNVVPLPVLPVIAADAPLARKVRFAQLREGLAYLDAINEVFRIGGWSSRFFQEYLEMLSNIYRDAADLEEKLPNRVPWYEARIRELREFERFTGTRVQNGSDPPDRLFSIRLHRLQAEAELLELKAQIASTVVAPSPPYTCQPVPVCVCQSVRARPRCGLLGRVFHHR